MAFSPLPLSYCTNVHPGLSAAAILDGLSRYSAPIAAKFGRPLAAGLWLARPVIDELLADGAPRRALVDCLRQFKLSCYTLNAFPYGNFHSDRVKEQVYLPDWTQDARREYTLACADILASVLPPNAEGSISTVPLGFKPLAQAPDFMANCSAQLIRTSLELAALRQKTGRIIRLAIEPEPCCVLETTPETIRFFQQLRSHADTDLARDAVQEHLGVCYDVCHQSVEFEDVVQSIQALTAAGIRINKVHITSAIEVSRPGQHPEAMAALARYAEPRYLHQTFARSSTGKVVHQLDLDAALCAQPPAEFQNADTWRIHFHVPVDRESLGPLQTTRPDLIRALAAVKRLDYAPHLEVETYTWEVLPGGEKPDIVAGFARELIATQQLLQELIDDD